MGLAKRIIELDNDLLSFNWRYRLYPEEKKQSLRSEKLAERRMLINFFKESSDEKTR
jgi:hypothetical protein